MGYGYTLVCRKCKYSRPASLGIGFLYPRLCAAILDDMKAGKFGKRFMEDANANEHASVHQERAIYVCDHCGAWKFGLTIDLCVPVGEPPLRDSRFAVAVDYPDRPTYVMTHEIGSKYTIVRSKKYMCHKCRKQLRPMKRNEKLKCPDCGTKLKITECFNWD